MKKLQPITDRTSAAELIDAAEKAADGIQVKQREKSRILLKTTAAPLPCCPCCHYCTPSQKKTGPNLQTSETE